jgi:asparagine synthase (glutamine-hydrolysing)
MCGIAGYFHFNNNIKSDQDLISRMVNMLKHRGPDEFGVYRDELCALGQARLSIIDLKSGQQPLANEDGNIWITFNGEIYDYIELRPELEKAGHKFRTKSDTEVIVHAYEQWGADCVKHFNGQFALAIYDKKNRSLFIARDRLGIRPVFYTIHNNIFYFASEIKSIFCENSIPRRLDYKGLDEIFTWWTTAPPRTAFENINELEPGTSVLIKDGNLKKSTFWKMEFPEVYDNDRPLNSWAEELHSLLVDSVRLRLRADVPVGGYLSGGLDSSATVALIKLFTNTRIETFSIAFHDKAYDESGYQNQMARFLGTNHHQITCTYKNIAENFPRVIWHTERPILRTAPTPLLMLSGLVRDNNFKVVLTGEGSDEILGGYDLFKETLIRRFWAKNPDSSWRASLLKRLYPTLPLSGARAKFYLETFYKKGLSAIDKYYFSHIPRINTTVKIKDYFTDSVKNQIGDYDSMEAFSERLPDSFYNWHHLARAQYLEAKSLLSGYLLSSQGDRVAAANSIETRFPFLDHRVVEFGAKVPPKYKIFGLKEKFVLKKAMAMELPENIINRVKQPYMAPDSNSFFQADSPSYIKDILSAKALTETGVFNPFFVDRLKAKCAKLSHAHLSFKDNMSIIGILSTQILINQYIKDFKPAAKLGKEAFKIWRDETVGAPVKK